jgi:hypothetical protein
VNSKGIEFAQMILHYRYLITPKWTALWINPAIFNAQLEKYVLSMGLDGVFTNSQTQRDFVGGVFFGNQFDDFLFPFTKD